MKAKDFIRNLLSVESYSFSLEEITKYTDGKRTSLKFELARLVEKKEIVSLRKGFYLIIPPRYSKQGHIPIQLYIEKLFKSLNRNYYVGFYTAAKFHGASHQQIHRDYVMIEKPKLNDIRKKSFDLQFLTTSTWSGKNLMNKKSDAGIFKVSSPALTSVDLIHHQTKLGGINRMLSVLEELVEEITPNDMEELLSWYPNKSSLQRFGFLLEQVGASQELSNQIKEYLQKSKFFPVLLSPKTGQKPGAVSNYWKVDVNVKLENDL